MLFNLLMSTPMANTTAITFGCMLKIVIAGSRSIKSDRAYTLFKEYMSEVLTNHRQYKTFVIISGGAEGVDQFAKRYAQENAFVYREFKPLYKHKNDHRAPLRRNQDMAKLGHVLVAMWDKKSTGTGHMIKTMELKKKKVYLLEH
jgi:hypothetical protein